MNTNTQQGLNATVKVEAIAEFVRTGIETIDAHKEEVPLTPYQLGQRAAFLELQEFFEL